MLITDSDPKQGNIFSSRIRARACGICIQNEKILMAGLRGLTKEGIFWSPPGGEIKFGESAKAAVKREFLEETNLIVEVGEFLFINEFIAPPLHAIELFYEVSIVSGIPLKGCDPELPEREQMLAEIRFMSLGDLGRLGPNQLHGAFLGIESFANLKELPNFLSES